MTAADAFVAKRFYETGSGSLVSADENESFLSSELIRLKTTEWFLREFKRIAQQRQVEISQGMATLNT